MPTFPPLLKGHPVDAGNSAFDAAVSACRGQNAGAGDVFWSLAEDVLDIAVVLEPEVAAGQCCQMLFTAMVAFGDSFGAIGPPEVGVFYRWPNLMLINAAKVGEARIAMPTCAEADLPRWLTVGLRVQIQPDETAPEPGYDLLNTCLWHEGAGEVDRTLLVESFARHFLTWINTWTDDGFKPVHENWTGRADGLDEVREITWQGEKYKGKALSIDEEGNLLLKKKAGAVSLRVLDAVEWISV